MAREKDPCSRTRGGLRGSHADRDVECFVATIAHSDASLRRAESPRVCGSCSVVEYAFAWDRTRAAMNDATNIDRVAERVAHRRRGSYGIDAPLMPIVLAGLAILYFVLAIITGRVMFWLTVTFVMAIEVSHLYFTLRGKFVLWAEVLDELKLRGDERILDMGCGRGAVLLMAAQHLTTGRAVGVDLWRSLDQSGNSIEATQRNAVAEGVADRVELHTGDMTALPFEDNRFDVVLSSLAIHNISARAGREKAISEAVRVLRPGGRMLIVDVRGTQQHRAQLAKLGMNDVDRTALRWWSWPARLVTATKPQHGD